LAPATLVTSMAENQRHIEDGLGLLVSLEAGAPNESLDTLGTCSYHQGKWGIHGINWCK
jgi:hypothetical protein